MQKPQFTRFRELTGERVRHLSRQPAHHRRDGQLDHLAEEPVAPGRGRTVQIPYFHGNLIRMPYVLLRNRLTGREAWFFNSHNPADAHGRRPALAQQGRRHRDRRCSTSSGPTTPRRRSSAPVTRTTEPATSARWSQEHRLRASNGGGLLGTSCVTPDEMHVDWVMGNTQVQFTSHTALHNAPGPEDHGPLRDRRGRGAGLRAGRRHGHHPCGRADLRRTDLARPVQGRRERRRTPSPEHDRGRSPR